MQRSNRRPGILGPGVGDALLAAAAFGCATPFAKRIGDGVNPQLFAGLLYLGSGLVLTASLVFRGREASLRRSDAPAMAGAVLFGGVVAPVLLMVGLRTTPAASASLLLNLEAVLTVLGAWLIAREHADKRIVLGMVVIVAGGLLLSVSGDGRLAFSFGAVAIAGACLCWAIDNVVTRPLSVRDPRQIAAVKGVVAGTVNVSLGLLTGGHLPSTPKVVGAVVIGFVGYGLSLVLYVRAMRQLGTARTGAYYAAAPFVGAAVALVWLREPVGRYFVPALILMAIGLAIHLRENHSHDHVHIQMTHDHGHDHLDEHHAHTDEVPPGSLNHTHDDETHGHGHTPDQHHQHDHR